MDDGQVIQIPDSMIVRSLGVTNDQNDKLLQLAGLLEGVLKKNIDSRNVTDQAIINKFISNSEVFSRLASALSVDAVKNMLKYANVHEVGKGRILYKNGADIDRVVVMLGGKFGIVKGQGPQSSKVQVPTTVEEKYRQILDTSPQIIKELKRKKFYTNFDIREYAEFKTTKANLYELEIKEKIETQALFNLHNLVEGKKYKNMLVTCAPSKFLSISSKIFYETFGLFLKKLKADKLRAFRKFECFQTIEDDKLLKVVEQLSIIKKKKGEYIYREGEPFECIYILFSGNIKITKTIDLFREDPNSLFLDRTTLNEGKSEILPFANLSEVYNYKPRTKLVELAEISDVGIFGEEEYYASMQREVNAQVSSQQAAYYEISLKKLETWLPEKKGFIQDFTRIIYRNRTQKKILFRQQKLAEVLQLENQNNMDYFYIEEGHQKPEPAIDKFKIQKVNQVISPPKPKRKQISHPALYNTFNFTKMERKNKRKQSHHQLSREENRIADLTHSIHMMEPPNQPSKKKYSMQMCAYVLSYFSKYHKEALRIEKESRMKSLGTSRSARPRTTQITGRSLQKS